MYINLKMLIASRKSSQTEIANALGVSQSAVSRMINLHTNLDDFQYEKLCALFGKVVVDRFRENNPRNQSSSFSENVPTGTPFYLLSLEQLHDIVEGAVTMTLQKLGVNCDEHKVKKTDDRSNELRPLKYWLKKMNVHRSTIWRWQQEGLIIPTHIRKKVFFRQRDFDEMFEKMKILK